MGILLKRLKIPFLGEYNQFHTWVGHQLLAVYLPPVLSYGSEWSENHFLQAMAYSFAITLIFVLREIQDFDGHEINEPHVHMDAPGVTKTIDLYGDLLGPITALQCFIIAYLMSL